jgi:hypothetical protein
MKQYEGKYEYYSVPWRSDKKKFKLDREGRDKQYIKVSATADEIKAVEQYILIQRMKTEFSE